MENLNIENQKKQLRQEYLLKRKNFSKKVRQEADKNIKTNLENLEQYQKAIIICFYLSKDNEVNTHALIKEELSKNKKKVVVPKVVDKNIDLYQINSWENLESGSFDILEPKSSLVRIKPENVNLFVIPGIVFSKNGDRIGWGRGYYDKLLNETTAVKIGLAYEFQVLDKIPIENHDVAVDCIVTEDEFFFF